jgi:hypothetical protein
MKNFKQIDKCDVWPYLQADKIVYAVILKGTNFNMGIIDLTEDLLVYRINQLLKEENVVFYEKIEK